jgi:hypothetical protein
LTASEPSSEDIRAPVGQSADSPEIAETPKGVCNSPYCEEDDYGDDSSSPLSPLPIVEATETDNVLGTNDNDREIQALYGATAIAADRSPHINNAEPSVPETSYKRRDTAPLKAAERQRTNRTHSAFDTGRSDKFLYFLAESSGQTSASATTSALSSPTLVGGKRSIVDIVNIIIIKITDKRIGSSGI